MQERRNSSVLAMELCLSCINPTIYGYWRLSTRTFKESCFITTLNTPSSPFFKTFTHVRITIYSQKKWFFNLKSLMTHLPSQSESPCESNSSESAQSSWYEKSSRRISCRCEFCQVNLQASRARWKMVRATAAPAGVMFPAPLLLFWEFIRVSASSMGQPSISDHFLSCSYHESFSDCVLRGFSTTQTHNAPVETNTTRSHYGCQFSP